MKLFRTIKVFYKDKLVFWLVNFSLLGIISTWSLFLFKRVLVSPLAVLHYNIYAGIDTLGNWYWLYILPGIILLISLLDFLLAVYFWTTQRVFSYFLLTIILLSNVIMFLFLFNILNYNI